KLNGTWYNSTLARKIVQMRSELRYETILSVLNMGDELKCMALATGNSVIDGVVHLRPVVPGTFKGDGAQYDPAVNRKTIAMNPSAEMHHALEASKVVVVGPAPTGPVINRVKDLFSDTEDSLLTPGRNLRVHGQRLRIAGDDPAVIGAWFVAANEAGLRIRVDDRDLIDNFPTTLTLVVPALTAGGYFLEITTRISSNGKTLMKTPRTCRFDTLLTVL
ncbi:MAG: DUF4469 domain-containing protein, partial [Tannerella sp.]|nr:DUF4469 domain-containing protein [Tannerella sp.]